MNNYVRIICAIIAMAFGVFMVIYGELDDSPGGQLMGVVFVVIGSIGILTRKKKIPDSPTKA